jgi:hypothetical protein
MADTVDAKKNLKFQAPKSQINSNIRAFKSQTKKGAAAGHWNLEFICYLGFEVWNFCASNIDNKLS